MMGATTNPIEDKLYRRGYRLYNRLFGHEYFAERNYDNTPWVNCRHITAAGAVILEGWVSA